MKKGLICAGIVTILLVGGYLILSLYTVKFIETKIQKVIGLGFAIDEIKVKTTHLSIKEIRIEEPDTKKTFLRIEEIRVYPALLPFLKKRLEIRKLIILKPSFFFYLTQEGVLIGPRVTVQREEKSREGPGEGKQIEVEKIPINIGCLRIEEGSIDFDDMKTDGLPMKIQLRAVYLEIKDIRYPYVSSRSPVELKGKIEGKTTTGEIFTKGWIDLETSDLETSLKIRGVELKVFEPYYRKRVSAEIESGYINMDGYIAIKKRTLDTAGKLEVADLQVREEGMVFYIPAKIFHSCIKGKGNRVEVHLKLKGNLDDPKFKLKEVVLMRVGIGLAEDMGLPAKVISEGLFEETGNRSKGLGEGLRSTKEIYKEKQKER